MTKKISVIVPCYNVEAYVDSCVQSLVNQTIGLENLEIILVNDASTDRTLEHLLEWEKTYNKNIMVITYEENIRQGGARNTGLQYATGEYISFIDSDDWIEPDMYEQLYSIAQKGNFDCVKGKMEQNKNEEDVHEYLVASKDWEYHFEKRGDYYFHDVPETGNIGIYGGIVTGIYKRSIILENEIWFPERLAYEDNYWGSIIALFLKDEYILDRVVYHYRFNPNSTLTTKNQLYQLDRLDIELAIVDAYKELGAFESFRETLEAGFIERFYVNTLFILFTRFDYIPEVFDFMREKVWELFPDFNQNPLIQKMDEKSKYLIQLLNIEEGVTTAELEWVKMAYLASFS